MAEKTSNLLAKTMYDGIDVLSAMVPSLLFQSSTSASFISHLHWPPLSVIYIAIMDFTKLDYQLEHIASQNGLPAETVLEKWLEKRQVSDPDGWRSLQDIPCIIGGLSALLGEFTIRIFSNVYSEWCRQARRTRGNVSMEVAT